MEQQNEITHMYQSQDGTIKVDVLFSEETVWLTQTQIGSLFGKAKSTISEHIKNIFEEGELKEYVVVSTSNNQLSMVRLRIRRRATRLIITTWM